MYVCVCVDCFVLCCDTVVLMSCVTELFTILLTVYETLNPLVRNEASVKTKCH